MGTVIYEASSLQAMFSLFDTTAVAIVLGIVGIVSAIFQKNQSMVMRAGLGLVGVLVILIGFGIGFGAFQTMSSGTVTTVFRLNEKHIRHVKCGDDGDTCTRYVLEGTSGERSLDLVVESSAYDLAQINTCYQVSYYASKSFQAAVTSSHQRVESVTRIEVADPAACP